MAATELDPIVNRGASKQALAKEIRELHGVARMARRAAAGEPRPQVRIVNGRPYLSAAGAAARLGISRERLLKDREATAPGGARNGRLWGAIRWRASKPVGERGERYFFDKLELDAWLESVDSSGTRTEDAFGPPHSFGAGVALGAKLREARLSLGMSLQELSERTDGISTGHLSSIENGRKVPSKEMLARLVEGLALEARSPAAGTAGPSVGPGARVSVQFDPAPPAAGPNAVVVRIEADPTSEGPRRVLEELLRAMISASGAGGVEGARVVRIEIEPANEDSGERASEAAQGAGPDDIIPS